MKLPRISRILARIKRINLKIINIYSYKFVIISEIRGQNYLLNDPPRLALLDTPPYPAKPYREGLGEGK